MPIGEEKRLFIGWGGQVPASVSAICACDVALYTARSIRKPCHYLDQELVSIHSVA
ncbi:hypothetical protein BS50DRAFT_568278 [Corynespora cassiicola Philippines]|uniref:Uncharacterized protein n=1 Tax=Corynespora cassiicola Philippines TaxID=1448308 RepID=A0A2T2P4U2_CORCC|nr:hypothetical protein BS50DRAFT_568278 [Corynespora cassiicola Philippines]